MKVLFYKLILVLTIFPNFLWANQCADLFTAHTTNAASDDLSEHGYTIKKPTKEQIRWMRSSLKESEQIRSTKPTIKIQIADKDKQDLGQFLIITKMEGKPWASKGKTHPNAPQGDPRWPFQILGTDVATVLGFDMPNADTIIIPTVHRINWGIEELNKILVSRKKGSIPYSFYEQRDTADNQYSKLAAQGKIPIYLTRENEASIAHGNLVTVHDMGYHLTMILEPVQLAQLRKIRLEVYDRYIDFALKSKTPSGVRVAEKLIDTSFTAITLTAEVLEHTTRNRNPNKVFLDSNYFITMSYSQGLLFLPKHSTFGNQNIVWLAEKAKEHKAIRGDTVYPADVITRLTLQRRRELAAAARQLMP